MQVNQQNKWIMTTSTDGCVVIVSEKRKTDKNDVIISRDCLNKNVSARKFTKHKTLIHNDKSVYVLTEDLQKFI